MNKWSEEELENLLESQIGLNKKFNGENWRETIEVDKLEIALSAEVSEYFESIPTKWKWWKPCEDDIQNAYIEIVDVIHFSVTYMLLEETSIDFLLQENGYLTFSTVNDMTPMRCFTAFFYNPELYNFYALINSLVDYGGLSWDKVLNIYNEKNKLNHERVDGGYMTGDYAKTDKDGDDDNRRIEIE